MESYLIVMRHNVFLVIVMLFVASVMFYRVDLFVVVMFLCFYFSLMIMVIVMSLH